ncbi:MAG: protoporphyrinogen oxidase, partial [Mycobacteriales bacterium]
MHQRHVVVLGGGISGLSAAYSLLRTAPAGTRITVVEASARAGGKLRTEEFAGLPVDTGADAFLARVPAGVRMARQLGLSDRLISPSTSSAFVYAAGALRPLPGGTALGVPMDLWPLAKSRLLSPIGMLRAAAEPLLPGRPVDGDMAVGVLVARRFGSQVRDRLVDPLLGGVYAGHADELSLDATSPATAAAAHTSRSLWRGLRARRAPKQSGPVFHSFAGGTSVLVDALVTALIAGGVDLRLATSATGLARSAGGWRLRLGDRAGVSATSGELDADAVVIALPALPASRLLADVVPVVAADLAAIDYASVGIVTLAYARGSVPPRQGSGFLVAASERRVIKAGTWTSLKWPHLAGDLEIVRCSVGRAGESADLQRDDEDLVAAVHQDLRAIAGFATAPVLSKVTRWGGALPQYAVGHVDRVERIERAVAATPALATCGAAYHTDCGACGVGCTLPAAATTSCTTGTCKVTTCNPGAGNCNGSDADGCETNTTTSLSHCGGCGVPCSAPNGTPSCSGSTCSISSCNAGFGNCNGSVADGCETDTTTSLAH